MIFGKNSPKPTWVSVFFCTAVYFSYFVPVEIPYYRNKSIIQEAYFNFSTVASVVTHHGKNSCLFFAGFHV